MKKKKEVRDQNSKVKLKKGDQVIVLSGKAKNQVGEILALNKVSQKVIVQGINQRKRFVRASQENPKGGVLEIEAPIHLSNIQYYDSKAKKGSRVKYGINKAQKKIRIAVKTNREID